MTFPLASAEPARLALDPHAIERLLTMVAGHVADGRYPGAQLAIARDGKLALARTFGEARRDPTRLTASDDTLWLLYSNTKVLTACAVWLLAERGALTFTDTVASHVPGFEANGKGEITIVQLLSHQGGFPNAEVPAQAVFSEFIGRDRQRSTIEIYPRAAGVVYVAGHPEPGALPDDPDEIVPSDRSCEELHRVADELNARPASTRTCALA